MKPKVSVITPTWQRHQVLLHRCLPSVRAQTFTEIEHLVISDGPDPELAALVPPSVRYLELPSHSPDSNQWGVYARLRGLEEAQGEYIAYLDDDNAFRPRHLKVLVHALEQTGAAFTYGLAAMHQAGGGYYLIGSPPPTLGQIDTSMLVHRRELLDKATWRVGFSQGNAVDWDLVERWLQANVVWTMYPEITVDYYF